MLRIRGGGAPAGPATQPEEMFVAMRILCAADCGAGPVRRAAFRLRCQSVSPSAPEGTAALDDATSVFLRARPRLFGIAYRMRGSSVEAEDVVQDVWLR
jgi:hypothetical protein